MKIGRITRDETAGLHGESNDGPLVDIHPLGWAVAAAKSAATAEQKRQQVSCSGWAVGLHGIPQPELLQLGHTSLSSRHFGGICR
jgi:hypothetical protein